jgi:alkylation response protein AidB-like acyl-CoA dehydrogenase
LLRDTARKFLDSECDTRFVRAMMATEAAVTPEFWGKLAENGWPASPIPRNTAAAGWGSSTSSS